MGDILHALPAVAGLRRHLPGAHIGWAIEPRWRDLLQSDSSMPLVDRVHLVPTREWKQRPFSIATLRQIAALRRELLAERYDLCIDLQGSIRSAVIGKMAQATRFVGSQRPREPQARALYGERIDLHAPHVIGQACELVSAALGTRLEPAPAVLPSHFTADLAIDYILERQLSRTALLVPTAGWGTKQWPIANYQQLALRLEQAGMDVLINSAPGQETSAQPIPGTTIPTTIRELIALTRRVSLVIGGDTGPIHLAAALNTPVVALFGPTDPARNGPNFPGAKLRILRHPASRTDHKRHPETDPGLASITVEEVLAAATELLLETSHA
jgi:heptosyltransferase-1